MSERIRLLAVLAVTAAVAGWLWTVQAQSLTAYDMTLASGRLSDLGGGHEVMTFDVSGALPGMLTLNVTVGSDGTITGGDWALVVAYVQDLNPDGTIATTPPPSGEDYDHPDFVNKGTLGGTVIGGSLTTDAGGAPVLSGAQLNIGSGTLTFASASTSGIGDSNANLGVTGAQGTLRLTF